MDRRIQTIVLTGIIILFFYPFNFCKGGDFGDPLHKPWNKLLNKHVSKGGNVDYKGFKNDYEILKSYLQKLSQNIPGAEISNNKKLAYWINVYNAFTVDLITRHYPVNSIKDIADDPWKIDFIELEDNKYTLNQIENKIIRQKFDEPRIHFALNCGAKSCPKLRYEAYFPSKLDQQLEKQTKDFINNTRFNKITKDYLKVSPIFKWYKSDFQKSGGIINFFKKYTQKNISQNAKVKYTTYDWSLNN